MCSLSLVMRIVEDQETGTVVHTVKIQNKISHLKIIAIIILKFEQYTKPRQWILRHHLP